MGRTGPRAAIFGCGGPVLSADERRFFADADPWGFIVFGRNVETPEQLAALVSDLRGCVGRDAPVLIDQEGGRVARLRPPYWADWDDAGTAVAALDDAMAETLLRLRYQVIGAELRALGIDVNCAPVLDVPQPGAHPVIGARAYGTTPERVARLGRAVWDGLSAGGVHPVIKHLPGHGRATVDSHLSLPVVDAPRETLEAVDFAAFRPLGDAPMGMTAHVVYRAIDPDACATLSPAVIRAIRDTIRFRGLLMTDDIGMGALTGPLGARAQRALTAGCDVVLHCSGLLGEMAEIAAVVPALTGDALARADAVIATRPEPDPVDPAEVLAMLRALSNGDADA
jgi:beta-N-acetylhexosaminidase